ncbi:MAG: metallophosphoesterase [Chlamydiota bacterium]
MSNIPSPLWASPSLSFSSSAPSSTSMSSSGSSSTAHFKLVSSSSSGSVSGSLLRLQGLISQCIQLWDPTTGLFKAAILNKSLIKEAESLVRESLVGFTPYDTEHFFGFIEKNDLPSGSKIFVMADTHGQLETVFYINKLLKEGFFENPNNRFIQLGDRLDRGHHSLHVFHLFNLLKKQYPNQVTLLRGNHENSWIIRDQVIQKGIAWDPNFGMFIYGGTAEENNVIWKELEDLFVTNPLAVEISQQGPLREYMEFNHAIAELYADPQPLLQREEVKSSMLISKERKISPRVELLAQGGNTSLHIASKRIQELLEEDRRVRDGYVQNSNTHLECKKQFLNFSYYNWADILPDGEKTSIGWIGARKLKISGEDLSKMHEVSSLPKATVEMTIRGHQHVSQISSLSNGKVVAITLPQIALEGAGDHALMISIAAKVSDWMVSVWRRQKGTNIVEIFSEIKMSQIKEIMRMISLC